MAKTKSEQRAEEGLIYDLVESHYPIIYHRTSCTRQPSPAFDFSEGDRTTQENKDECDINQIMARWQRNQPPTHIKTSSPQYGDFSSVGEYQDAILRVQAVSAHFATLPARVRDACGNDPARYLEVVGDPNQAELVESWNLTTKPPEPDVPASGGGAPGGGVVGPTSPGTTP